VDKAHRRIIHYGRYSYAAFRQGKNTARRLDETKNGISKEFSVQQGLDQATLKAVNNVLDGGREKIIYVGEVHDRFTSSRAARDHQGIDSQGARWPLAWRCFRDQHSALSMTTWLEGAMSAAPEREPI
jgi:hypothetical protein